MRHLALAIPFFLGAFGMRAAVVPVGDAIAAALHSAVPSMQRAAPRDEAAREISETGGEQGVAEPSVAPRRTASRGAAGRRREDVSAVMATDLEAPQTPLDAPVKGTIVIPASAVKKALEHKDVGATNAKGPDGAPLGARLVGVGKYGLGLRDGDVVVAVQGTRTPTVQAMVGAAMGAASGGATRLSGRVLRGGAVYAVVLEVPRD